MKLQTQRRIREAYYFRTSSYSNAEEYDKPITDYKEAVCLNLDGSMSFAQRGLAYFWIGDTGSGKANAVWAININIKYDIGQL